MIKQIVYCVKSVTNYRVRRTRRKRVFNMESRIKNITVIGTGVIGKGWITRFLSHGYNVVAHDIAEGAEEKLRKDLEAAWPGFIERGIAKEGDLDRLTFEA